MNHEILRLLLHACIPRPDWCQLTGSIAASRSAKRRISDLTFFASFRYSYPTSVDRYLIKHYHCYSAKQHYIQLLHSSKHGRRIKCSFAVGVHHQRGSNTHTISTRRYSQNRANSSPQVSDTGSWRLPRLIRKLSISPQLHL